MPRPGSSLTSVLVLLAAVVSAQTSQSADVGTEATEPQGAPVFRSAVELVSIDATVVDNRGWPIAGLAPEHFRLEVDGQPRTIVSVQFVARSRGASGISPSPARFEDVSLGTDETMDEGRLILVAVDQTGIQNAERRAALRAVADIIDQIAPTDRVAVSSVNHTGRLEFHTNRSRSRLDLERLAGEQVAVAPHARFGIGLAESLDIANGRRSRLDQTAQRECGGAGSQIFDGKLSGAGGSVQSLCFMQLEQEARVMAQSARTQTARSLDSLMNLLVRLRSIERPKTLVLLSEGFVVEPPTMDMMKLGAAAHQAAVTIYTLQLKPAFEVLEARDSSRWIEDAGRLADGLARLADMTGGALFHQVGADPEPLRRVLREQSGHYLLAFEPTATERDDRPHRIRLSLTERGATLRSRTVFRLETADVARRRTERRLAELLRSSAGAGDLPVRATSFVFPDPATGQVRLLVGGEIGGSTGSALEGIFAYVLQDGDGVIVASEIFDTPADRFVSGAVVPPGRYTLRVAAIDRLSRAGSTARAVSAVTGASEVPMSDLVVARAGPGVDGSIDPIFEETEDEQVFCYLELYPRLGHPFRDVEVTMSIRPPTGGQALLSRPAAIWSLGPRQATARLTLPLSGLPPGPYVVRAEVSAAGRIIGFVERPLTIVR